MSKFWPLALFILVSFKTFSCELPMNEKIVIGCTYKCEFMYRMRLSLAAMTLGYPIQIIDLRSESDISSALTKVDGVLMPGGADINPDVYLNNLTPDMKDYVKNNLNLVKLTEESRERDAYESELLNLYSKNEKFSKLPFLGICRGMQMMSVTQGIPLYLDLQTDLGLKNKKYDFDKVTITENSIMNDIYQNEEISALKIHHQALKLSYFEANQKNHPEVKVTSYSNGRSIAESIEFTHRPALGVQYHPELSSPNTAQVLKWFLKKSCEYKNSVKAVL